MLNMTRDRLDAVWLAGCVLAVALALLFGGEGRCAIPKDEVLPFVLEQRAGCPEALP